MLPSAAAIREGVRELAPQVVAWRRHLHRHPERSFEEFATAAFVRQTLAAFSGFVVRQLTPTSVVADLLVQPGAPWLALRADMDALPVEEAVDLPYRSQTPGVMHACGHDGHTAILLGVACLLSRWREQLSANVRLIFQHAEEKPPGGARELVAAGVLDGIRWVVGLHLRTALPVGQVAVRVGVVNAAVDNFDVVIRGRGGHAGHPHRAANPLGAAAHLVGLLQGWGAWERDPFLPGALVVTQITGGSAHNVIPAEATVRGTIRTLDGQLRQQAGEALKRIAGGVAAASGCEVVVDLQQGYDPVVNDPETTLAVASILRQALGAAAVVESQPHLVGEDFSAYLARVPGTFFHVGAGNPARGITYANHSPWFQLDEDALAVGVEALANIACFWPRFYKA